MTKPARGAMLLFGFVAFLLAIAAIIASPVELTPKLLTLALVVIVAGVGMAMLVQGEA